MPTKAANRAIVVRSVAVAALAVALCMPVGAQVSRQHEESSCEVCHSKITVAYQTSIHAGAGIDCVTCHGGNPTDLQATAMAAHKGFRGSPSRREIPGFCSSCHADRAQMRQYGLSTHQFEDYQSSAHGQAWLRGDESTAVCTDCHGQHRILPHDDPNSMVFPMNVADTCSRCHSDEKLMSKHGLPANAYEEYQESAHAQMLASGGRQSAATCTSCHGSHTALPPGANDIPNMCSQCHAQVKELVSQSPHGEVVKKGEMSCESCHGHHAILHATDELLMTSCKPCHQADTAAMGIGQQVYDLITTARQHHDSADEIVQAMEQHGLYVEELKGRIEETNTSLQQLERDQHALQPRQIEQGTVAVEALADEVASEFSEIEARLSFRRLLPVPMWVYIGLMVLFIYWKRKQTEPHRFTDTGAKPGTGRPPREGLR